MITAARERRSMSSRSGTSFPLFLLLAGVLRVGRVVGRGGRGLPRVLPGAHLPPPGAPPVGGRVSPGLLLRPEIGRFGGGRTAGALLDDGVLLQFCLNRKSPCLRSLHLS